MPNEIKNTNDYISSIMESRVFSSVFHQTPHLLPFDANPPEWDQHVRLEDENKDGFSPRPQPTNRGHVQINRHDHNLAWHSSRIYTRAHNSGNALEVIIKKLISHPDDDPKILLKDLFDIIRFTEAEIEGTLKWIEEDRKKYKTRVNDGRNDNPTNTLRSSSSQEGRSY